MPLGYHEFAEILNLAPGVLTCFAYIPKGKEEVVAPRPGPNRCKFYVAPNNLYHAYQVTPHGSQVLSPSHAGIMMQMLWKNAEEASSVQKDNHPSFEDRLGIKPQPGKHC